MTTTIQVSVQDKVRNYQGQNNFILNMKEALKKWGGLTPKQLQASEKALNSEVKVINKEELPETVKRIVDYKGENTFVKDIASKFQKYGTLTSKQIEAAVKQIQKEEDKEKTVRMNWPTLGETIIVGRKIGIQLKEKYGLEFNPVLLDITKLKAVSPKAVMFEGKMTVKRGDVCMCCGRTLTDEFSMLTKMGKICAGHMKVEYITDASQAEAFRERYLKRVEEIGAMEFWVPKNQIKKWNGSTESVIPMLTA
jgi:DNA-binding FrmR family transcriptional regulator